MYAGDSKLLYFTVILTFIRQHEVDVRGVYVNFLATGEEHVNDTLEARAHVELTFFPEVNAIRIFWETDICAVTVAVRATVLDLTQITGSKRLHLEKLGVQRIYLLASHRETTIPRVGLTCTARYELTPISMEFKAS